MQNQFWVTLLSPAPSSTVIADVAVGPLEGCWKQLFTLLPLFEFDAQGTLETGRRFKVATDVWAPARKLITPVLEVYMSKSKGQSPSFNAYCRALFSRCLYLINAWGWRTCDSIIGILFDFFARNSLHHLRNEESHGSPAFLDHLTDQLTLAAEAEDRCFHLLLKIIGSGIRFMRRSYPEKKIRDLTWRLMPNHGRFHPKEEAIRQEDLDALRNHHDLLCTLYWASPPKFRPRLSVIRHLVNIENSHKEACHINIRAWSYLIRYQLSTDEPISSLGPFVEWHDDLLHQLLRQHGLARIEAEEQVRSIQHVQGLLVSQQLLESTVAKNQRQVEYVLADALTCLRRAIQAAGTVEVANKLLSPKLTAVFAILDSKRVDTSSPIIEALDVILAYIESVSRLSERRVENDQSDDSQDFGVWPGFEEQETIDDAAASTPNPLQDINDPLRQLLSNCFGADVTPSDSMLSKVLETWAAVGQSLVTAGPKVWPDYIGSYGNDTWSTLRDTDQTRKYTSHYLATVLEKDKAAYKANKIIFLRFWVESLVERESLLKFQHRLTSAVLNADDNDPLLANPPFWRSKVSSRFEITPVLFSERRLSLLSMMLSNMRTFLEDATRQQQVDKVQMKSEYRELLKHLMARMKHNYQELGHASNIKGAYVDFVHKVVEALQQHTSGICPIDRFFTDNVSFPLPATDPTYVVGQLKNYGMRLQEPRAPKELAIFLQSISERAAIDGQQAYLVDQLFAAMSNSFEDGGPRQTLRACIVKSIMPAYMEMAFKTSCGWILAFPLLDAARMTFAGLLMDLDGYNPRSVNSMASTISSFLGTMRTSFSPLLEHPILLQKATTMKTIRACYDCVTALLPTLDYLVRLNAPVGDAVNCIDFFDAFAQEGLLNTRIPDPLTAHQNLVHQIQSISDTRKFATEELRQAVEKSWICVDEHYFIARGTSRREVIVDVGLAEEEKTGLGKTLQDFLVGLQGMPALQGNEEQMMHDISLVGELDDLII